MQRRSMFRRSSDGARHAARRGSAAATGRTAAKCLIEPDGTVHMPAQTVPVSGFLSLEGKAYLAEHLAQSAAA